MQPVDALACHAASPHAEQAEVGKCANVIERIVAHEGTAKVQLTQTWKLGKGAEGPSADTCPTEIE